MIRISDHGGIIINKDIVCDGHHPSATLRIQSHIHSDHLADFGSSKQQFNILMSKQSKEYLGLGKNNLDIAHRPGIVGIDYDQIFDHNDYKIRLLSSEHCLGSVQMEIITPSGESYGYSGDFNYPMEKVINVNHLVIDGNCGGLFKFRTFSREDSITALQDKLFNLLQNGPVFIKSYKGLLEKIYFWISDIRPEINRISSNDLIESLKLHEKYSYGIVGNLVEKNSKEAIKLAKSREKFIQLVYHKEQIFNLEKKQVINCDRWIDRADYPIKEISPIVFHISMSDHADMKGTLEYIKNVSPMKVYIDGIRTAGYAPQLANIIENECSTHCEVLIPSL